VSGNIKKPEACVKRASKFSPWGSEGVSKKKTLGVKKVAKGEWQDTKWKRDQEPNKGRRSGKRGEDPRNQKEASICENTHYSSKGTETTRAPETHLKGESAIKKEGLKADTGPPKKSNVTRSLDL